MGDHDWPTTFHRIPKLVHDRLKKLGAHEITPLRLADVKVDLLGPFDDWSEAVVGALGSSGGKEKEALQVRVEKSDYIKSLERQNVAAAAVVANVELADTTVGPAKRHMEIRLPEGFSYVAGDYLVVQPRNPDESVRKVLRYFGLEDSSVITIPASNKAFLPSGPIQVGTFFSDYVELSTPVTKRQLQMMAQQTATEADRQQLERLYTNHQEWLDISQRRCTILEVLMEKCIDTLPLGTFIDLLLPLTPRQYSISSSPLADDAQILSVTYDVHSAPALSGHGVFEGVCSTYLASRKPGDQIYCYVRPSNVNFRLPASLDTPILMFAAGTGIAPMRAFCQERAAVAAARSTKPGPALLFYGCRDSESDFLYRDELRRWEKEGIVTVFPAHSRAPASGRPKYVHDAIWMERETCADLFMSGGKIYLCGSANKLGRSCADVCKKIYMDRNMDKTAEDAQEWLDGIKTDRYISDVY